MLANAGCFYFPQGCSNGCGMMVCVLDCSFLVFQSSMSFLATWVYFLEKWLLKSLPVLRAVLFIACYWVGGVWDVFSLLAVWFGDSLSHSLACSFTPLIVLCRNTFAFWRILDYVLSPIHVFCGQGIMNEFKVMNFSLHFLPIILYV